MRHKVIINFLIILYIYEENGSFYCFTYNTITLNFSFLHIIFNSSNSHRVGIWGDLAKAVSEEYENFDPEERVIVILTSIKMSTYKSMYYTNIIHAFLLIISCLSDLDNV